MPRKRARTGFEKHVSRADGIIAHVVATHLWIEHLLIRSLAAVLPRPDAIFRRRPPSFAALVDLSEALEVVAPDFADVLRRVNALRNKFAHRISFEPEAEEIRALQKSLRDMKSPFLISLVPPSKREMMIALASISGYLERRARELGAKDIDGY